MSFACEQWTAHAVLCSTIPEDDYPNPSLKCCLSGTAMNTIILCRQPLRTLSVDRAHHDCDHGKTHRRISLKPEGMAAGLKVVGG